VLIALFLLRDLLKSKIDERVPVIICRFVFGFIKTKKIKRLQREILRWTAILFSGFFTSEIAVLYTIRYNHVAKLLFILKFFSDL